MQRMSGLSSKPGVEGTVGQFGSKVPQCIRNYRTGPEVIHPVVA